MIVRVFTSLVSGSLEKGVLQLFSLVIVRVTMRMAMSMTVTMTVIVTMTMIMPVMMTVS